jgi:hypothetical protein
MGEFTRNQRTNLLAADCLAGGTEFELSVPFLKKRNASATSPRGHRSDRLGRSIVSGPLSFGTRQNLSSASSLKLCRLPGTNPANFLEARFWIVSVISGLHS